MYSTVGYCGAAALNSQGQGRLQAAPKCQLLVAVANDCVSQLLCKGGAQQGGQLCLCSCQVPWLGTLHHCRQGTGAGVHGGMLWVHVILTGAGKCS